MAVFSLHSDRLRSLFKWGIFHLEKSPVGGDLNALSSFLASGYIEPTCRNSEKEKRRCHTSSMGL
jgi:hypothetical protein